MLRAYHELRRVSDFENSVRDVRGKNQAEKSRHKNNCLRGRDKSLHALDREHRRLEGVEFQVGVSPVDRLGLMGNQFHTDVFCHPGVREP